MTSTSVRSESDSVRSVLHDYLIRQAPITAALTDTRRTETFCETFLPASLLVAEEFGGAGGSIMDALDVAAEAGGALLGGSVLGALLSTYALTVTSSSVERDVLLNGIAADRVRLAAPVWLTSAGRDDAPLVFADAAATHALLLTGVGDTARLVVVDLAGAGLEALEGIDPTRPLARLRVDEAAGIVLAAGRAARDARARYVAFARVALAVEQGAGARRCIELSLDYAQTRTQFGVPIASFQAVKHTCATMHVDCVEAQSLTDVAAAAIAGESIGDPARATRLPALAKALMSEAFTSIARSAIEVHGGVGFAWEHPVQLFYKRSLATSAYFGSPAEHYLEIARAESL